MRGKTRKLSGGGCGCGIQPLIGGGEPAVAKGPTAPQARTPFNPNGGGRRAVTAKNRKALAAYRRGKSIGFTMRAHLKAMGLIPRTSRKNKGKYVVSRKYK